jgi:glucose-6-phosphate isomerase
MLSKTDPRSTAAWKSLTGLAEQYRTSSPTEIPGITKDHAKYSLLFGNLYFDYSRNLVNEDVLSSLFSLAAECHLKESISALFSGDPINETEKRSVLHTALRDFSGDPVLCGGQDVMPGVRASLKKIKKFCNAVHKGGHNGYTGKQIKYIVNIGIGGSDLGPRMVVDALAPYQLDGIETYFVSNVDAQEISAVLDRIKPERTLFLVASKTFTTSETMANAVTAKNWFLRKAKHNRHIARHFVAISSNEKAALEFGIDAQNIFSFRDWVGGRFSLWGPVGLSIALSIGYRRFEELLRGANSADIHFRNSPPGQNIPVIMALLSTWYTNFLGTTSEAILPYDQRLQKFPAYLQQACMESNGKSTDRSGQAVDYSTSPVTWGEPGTNGQHAFFQLLHQGTQVVPCDFIAFAKPHHAHPGHHRILISNFLAQPEALLKGKSETEVQAELENQGLTTEEIAAILPFRIFTGNRPSNSFLIRELSPFNLGALIALYEHKIFVQGIIWNIYSFDQWGVELGKQLAKNILPHLSNENKTEPADAVTAKMIRLIKEWQ